jgi:hypothetical protein
MKGITLKGQFISLRDGKKGEGKDAPDPKCYGEFAFLGGTVSLVIPPELKSEIRLDEDCSIFCKARAVQASVYGRQQTVFLPAELGQVESV